MTIKIKPVIHCFLLLLLIVISNINFAYAEGTEGGDSEIPQYVAGAYYGPNQQVKNLEKVYQCKPWPASGWCSQAVYAPGQSIYWSNAWDFVRNISDGSSTGGSTSTTGGSTSTTGGSTSTTGGSTSTTGGSTSTTGGSTSTTGGSTSTTGGSTSTTGGSTGGTVDDDSQITQYVAGAYYGANQLVRHLGKIYQCKSGPAAGWCQQAAYEPGQSAFWTAAWNFVRNVTGDSGTTTLNVTEYAIGMDYKSGDVVSNRGGIYRCKGSPYTPWCSQPAYEPGNEDNGQVWWKDAWDYLGADSVSVNSSNGQIAITLPDRPDASFSEPEIEVNGESFTISWGSRTLLKTMNPGTYKITAASSGEYLAKFVQPDNTYNSADVSLTAGKITEVKIEYILKDEFAKTTLNNVCSQCHFDANKFDTEIRAEKWLFNKSRTQLMTRISQMRRGTICTGGCSEVMADYLRNNVWEAYRTSIVDRVNSGNGQLPDNKGKRIIRLLTRFEYLSTIKDAIGIDLSKDDFSDYIPGRHLLFPTIQDRTVTENLLSEYIKGAVEVEKNINKQYFTQCDSADTACLVITAGRDLFHRPLTSSETNDFVDIADNEGLGMAISAMTLSPNFLYRTEIGEANTGSGYQLTQYEIAAAMSYAYTGHGPDELLWELADNGDLASPAIREIQARRLMKTDNAKIYLSEFFQPLVEISDGKLKMKDGIMSQGLINDMKSEMQLMLADVVINEPAGFDKLYNPGFTYLNTDLANHYGVSTSGVNSSMTKVVTPSNQGGLLHLGIFHASNSDEVSTHLIRRSRIVRENLLCKNMGTPVGTIPEQIIAPELASSRDFWTQVNGPDSGVCWSCHVFMNDIGFALDSFDIQGRYRTTEKVQGTGSRLGDEETFNLLTYGTFIIDGGDAAFNDLRGMTQTIGASDRNTECLSTRYLQFTRGYKGESSDPAYLKNVYDNNGRILDLMVNQVLLPSFINKQ